MRRPDRAGGRLLALVSVVVLVDTAFYAAITPLLPEYVDDLGLSKTQAGVLTGAFAAGTLLGSLPSAWLAARIGPRRTVLAGLATVALSSLVFGLAGDFTLLAAARFMQGLGGAASWAGGLTWLIAASPAQRRGELIGIALGAAVAGALLGPVIGSIATVTGPEAVFGSLCAFNAGLALWALRVADADAGAPMPLREVFAAIARPAVLVGVWLMVLPSLFSGLFNTLVPLRLDELGASAVAIGGVYLLAAALEASLSPVAGRVSDRRGRIAPLTGGLAATVAVALLLPWPESIAVVAVLTLAGGVAAGWSFTPAIALLSDAAERVGMHQAYAFGLTNLAWAAGQAVGAGAGGTLADGLGDAVPYAITAAFGAATVVVVRSRTRLTTA